MYKHLMKKITQNIIYLGSICVIILFFNGCQGKIDKENKEKPPMEIQIIVGSVRDTNTGENIAQNIKNIADKNGNITTEIIKIKDYNLPLYADKVAPASQVKAITDPILKKWSDIIKKAHAYIIIVPEYNAGYPGALKNALDSLYVEWKNKPVAFVGYSGGPSGGAAAISQLKQVATKGFSMI